jgi:hypothetical protein
VVSCQDVFVQLICTVFVASQAFFLKVKVLEFPDQGAVVKNIYASYKSNDVIPASFCT